MPVIPISLFVLSTLLYAYSYLITISNISAHLRLFSIISIILLCLFRILISSSLSILFVFQSIVFRLSASLIVFVSILGFILASLLICLCSIRSTFSVYASISLYFARILISSHLTLFSFLSCLTSMLISFLHSRHFSLSIDTAFDAKKQVDSHQI